MGKAVEAVVAGEPKLTFSYSGCFLLSGIWIMFGTVVGPFETQHFVFLTLGKNRA